MEASHLGAEILLFFQHSLLHLNKAFSPEATRRTFIQFIHLMNLCMSNMEIYTYIYFIVSFHMKWLYIVRYKQPRDNIFLLSFCSESPQCLLGSHTSLELEMGCALPVNTILPTWECHGTVIKATAQTAHKQHAHVQHCMLLHHMHMDYTSDLHILKTNSCQHKYCRFFFCKFFVLERRWAQIWGQNNSESNYSLKGHFYQRCVLNITFWIQ